MRSPNSIFPIFLFALLSLSCFPPYSASATPSKYKPAVKIGWIGPLTGNAAVLGTDSVVVARMVFEEVNRAGGVHGRNVQLVVEDDAYKTPKSVSSYNKLVKRDKVSAIIMITYGGLFALAPRAERDDILLLDPLDCDEEVAKLPKNTICIAKRTEDLGYRNAEYAVKNEDTPVGIIYYDGDPFMGTVARSTQERLKQLGHPPAFAEAYLDDTTDFKSYLALAKKRKVKSLLFYGYDQMGLAMKQAREQKIESQFYALNVITSPGYRKLAGDASEGTLLARWTAPRGERFDRFLKEFEKRKGRPPLLEISTVPTYDIAMEIVAGLKKAMNPKTGKVDTAVLREHFYSLENHPGLSGSITIDPDGIVRSFPVRMFRYAKGEYTLVGKGS